MLCHLNKKPICSRTMQSLNAARLPVRCMEKICLRHNIFSLLTPSSPTCIPLWDYRPRGKWWMLTLASTLLCSTLRTTCASGGLKSRPKSTGFLLENGRESGSPWSRSKSLDTTFPTILRCHWIVLCILFHHDDWMQTKLHSKGIWIAKESLLVYFCWCFVNVIC